MPSNQMSNQKLGKLAIAEIRDAMKGLSGARASETAQRLAALYDVTPNQVYNMTQDIRPRRKKRADQGKRTAALMEHDGLKAAAALVVSYHLDPADALATVKLRGYTIPVELATFQRYLREHGLSGQQRRNPTTPHVRFEADAPGAVFQFDISGSKQRWFDLETRKILTVSTLEVSKNHDNDKPNRVRIWRFSLLDDHSRRRFVRFFGVDKPNGTHVVEFLMEAYNEMGVPLQLFTDNDAIIKSGRNARAAKILNRILADSGGYALTQHLPGNSRATGKVENSHKNIEQVEKLIGLFLAEGRTLDLATLNAFGDQITARYNDRTHRTTGETPNQRWQATLSTVRKVPFELLRDALLADEFTAMIRGDVTVSHKGQTYQLPTSADTPFSGWIGQKVTLIAPDSADFFFVVGADGIEYEVSKTAAAPHAMGEFRAVADSEAQKNRKELKRHAKELAKATKEARKQGATPAPIPYFDTRHEAATSNVAQFPKPEIVIAPAVVAEVAPVATAIYEGRTLGYWEALAACQQDAEFATPATPDEKAWLADLCGGRDGSVNEQELITALENRTRKVNFRLIKSA